MAFECTVERPWGIHGEIRNDERCPRCGWTAPGPIGDAVLDAACLVQDRERLVLRAADLGLIVIDPAAQERLAA
jgi:hypothetical protein